MASRRTKTQRSDRFLINLIGTDKDLRDYCIVWSLGFCGDETTIPTLEKLSNHTAEFVRRISREATFKFADETTKNLLREKIIAELPEVLRNLAKFGTAESFGNALNEELSKPKAEEAIFFNTKPNELPRNTTGNRNRQNLRQNQKLKLKSRKVKLRQNLSLGGNFGSTRLLKNICANLFNLCLSVFYFLRQTNFTCLPVSERI